MTRCQPTEYSRTATTQQAPQPERVYYCATGQEFPSFALRKDRKDLWDIWWRAIVQGSAAFANAALASIFHLPLR